MKVPTYPTTGTIDQVDTYHGVPVSDPYRWLEDSGSTQQAEWIAAQNAATAEYLAGIGVRDELQTRFMQLLDYPRYYDFVRRGPYLVFKKNSGLQKQPVLYVQRGLAGNPEVLVDPSELAPDGTTRLRAVAMSEDARYVAYGVSHRGVEWEECHVKDMNTRRALTDRLQWVKAARIAWRGSAFYYSRYPSPANPAKALTAPNEHHQVWYHRVGTPQSADHLVYEDTEHPGRLHIVQTTNDERFVVLMISSRRVGHAGCALWLLDEGSPCDTFRPLVTAFDDVFWLVDNEDDRLLFVTNRRAPNRRVVLVDPRRPAESNWQEIIGEQPHPLDSVGAIGDRLFVTYRHDAAHRLYVFDRTGRFEHEIALPGIGLVHVVPGQRDDTEALWTFTSFTTPPIVYRYDIAERASSTFLEAAVRLDADLYETKRVFYPSKDGTRIPMFIVHRKGLALDGRSPGLLYGYGGYGASVGPSFDPFLGALLERGVVYAVACLRGGGEYGEAWHHAGWREKKQNVFGDCIAAAEWLQAQGYTSRDRCALFGASNGGLLVGAVMTQRPDLFAVALPCAGPMDMLRFQRFTLAAGSVAEWGSSDDPAMFPILIAYSPLHNIKPGVSYPATLVTTYDHDDCVVPAHSFKFAATLQARGAGPRPYLIRIESNSGHGSASLPKAVEERADIYAFLLAHLPGAVEGQNGIPSSPKIVSSRACSAGEPSPQR